MPWLWKSRDLEQELIDLSEQIKKADASVVRVQQRKRRLQGLLLIYSSIIWTLYVATSLATHRFSQRKTKLFTLLGPVAIAALYKLVSAIMVWRTSVAKSKFKTLQAKHEKLVSEYKAKTNYDHIKNVIELSKTPREEKQAKTKKAPRTPKTPKSVPVQGPTQPNQPIQGPPPGQPQIPQAVQQYVQPKRELQASQLKTPTTPETPRAQIQQQTPEAIGARQVPPSPLPPRLAQFAQPPPRTWMDRLFDLVLGENETSPNSRYALICEKCRAVNGLAPYGENPESVPYRCAYCGHQNNFKKTEKPELHETRESSESSSSGTPEMKEKESNDSTNESI